MARSPWGLTLPGAPCGRYNLRGRANSMGVSFEDVESERSRETLERNGVSIQNIRKLDTEMHSLKVVQ